MAKKLTNEVLQKMVMQVLAESNLEEQGLFSVGGVQGALRKLVPYGRKGPDISKFQKAGQFTAEDMLKRLASDPQLPQSLKQEISMFLSAHKGAEYKTAFHSAPTVTQKAAFHGAPTANIEDLEDLPTSKLSKSALAQAQLKTKSKSPSIGTSSDIDDESDLFSTSKKLAAESKNKLNLESLVAEVLAEISDKERRDLEAHYGPDMRGAEASKKQLDKIDAAIKGKKERLKNLKDLKGLRGHYGEDMSGKKQNDKKIAELEKEIKELEAELGSKKTAKK